MMTSADLSSKFALDVQAVDGLRLDARKTDKAGLEAAAKQFESLFMNMMLKSMRQASSRIACLIMTRPVFIPPCSISSCRRAWPRAASDWRT